MLINPYKPGAGKMPAYLAGRDSTLKNAEEDLIYLQNGYARQSKIYYGLRGVGKTVLLNAIENSLESFNILHDYIEVSENDKFKQTIYLHILKLINKMSAIEAFKIKAKEY